MIGVVVSCEHAGNAVPSPHEAQFRGLGALLESHRGWDPGAAELAGVVAERFDTSPLLYPWTRLVVEVNRSEGHPALFSKVTRGLDVATREGLLRDLYRPHRQRVTQALAEQIERCGRVLHLGIHTFTPVYDGRPRSIDVASLDDPRRPLERTFTNAFLGALRDRRPTLRLARNRPYRGWADGLTTALRAYFPADAYLGIELEVSQSFPLGDAAAWAALQTAIAEACSSARASRLLLTPNP